VRLPATVLCHSTPPSPPPALAITFSHYPVAYHPHPPPTCSALRAPCPPQPHAPAAPRPGPPPARPRCPGQPRTPTPPTHRPPRPPPRRACTTNPPHPPHPHSPIAPKLLTSHRRHHPPPPPPAHRHPPTTCKHTRTTQTRRHSPTPTPTYSPQVHCASMPPALKKSVASSPPLHLPRWPRAPVVPHPHPAGPHNTLTRRPLKSLVACANCHAQSSPPRTGPPCDLTCPCPRFPDAVVERSPHTRPPLTPPPPPPSSPLTPRPPRESLSNQQPQFVPRSLAAYPQTDQMSSPLRHAHIPPSSSPQKSPTSPPIHPTTTPPLTPPPTPTRPLKPPTSPTPPQPAWCPLPWPWPARSPPHPPTTHPAPPPLNSRPPPTRPLLYPHSHPTHPPPPV